MIKESISVIIRGKVGENFWSGPGPSRELHQPIAFLCNHIGYKQRQLHNKYSLSFLN